MTSGNALTIASGASMVVELSQAANLPLSDVTVTVVGGGGSIGKGTCKYLLIKGVGKVIIVGRNRNDMSAALDDIRKESGRTEVVQSYDLHAAIKESNYVIFATSSTDGIDYEPDWFKQGVVPKAVIDLQRPRGAGKDLHQLDDVLVLAGGMYWHDSVIASKRFNDYLFACQTESIILAMDGRTDKNYSIGDDIPVDKIMIIEKLAIQHGFYRAGLRDCYDNRVSKSKLERWLAKYRQSDSQISAGLKLLGYK